MHGFHWCKAGHDHFIFASLFATSVHPHRSIFPGVSGVLFLSVWDTFFGHVYFDRNHFCSPIVTFIFYPVADFRAFGGTETRRVHLHVPDSFFSSFPFEHSFSFFFLLFFSSLTLSNSHSITTNQEQNVRISGRPRNKKDPQGCRPCHHWSGLARIPRCQTHLKTKRWIHLGQGTTHDIINAHSYDCYT